MQAVIGALTRVFASLSRLALSKSFTRQTEPGCPCKTLLPPAAYTTPARKGAWKQGIASVALRGVRVIGSL
jgi:hypothetical protein